MRVIMVFLCHLSFVQVKVKSVNPATQPVEEVIIVATLNYSYIMPVMQYYSHVTFHGKLDTVY